METNNNNNCEKYLLSRSKSDNSLKTSASLCIDGENTVLDDCYRMRSNTSVLCNQDRKFTHFYKSATEQLIKQSFIAATSITLRAPPHLTPVEAPHTDTEDTTLDYIGSTNSVGLGIRSAPSTPMSPLHGHIDSHHGQSTVFLNSPITKSPSHASSKNDIKSIRQLSTSVPLSGASSVTVSGVTNLNNRSTSPHPTKSSKIDSSDKEKDSNNKDNKDKDKDKDRKEKKRKELSSSRQKKFYRHFQQVSNDERVINYFSCALVSDILLQGHLYITDNYFAFYSNVFGFVTKLLIPTVSVVKISKEKTAKIIPNAVGVATIDERHVFGSFMSREAAFRLMLSVWRPVAPVEPEIEIPPKIPDVEISECSIEDDSSCSVSGNESSSQIQMSSVPDVAQTVVRHRSIVATAVDGLQSSAEDISIIERKEINNSTPIKIPLNPPIISATIAHNLNNNNTNSNTNNLNTINNKHTKFHIKFPTNFHIVYLGVILSIILSLLSGFLFYRIQDIQAKTNSYSPLDFKWSDNVGQNLDVYNEVVKWQKEMQTKSVEEAQIILNSNLEQIAKVRQSLETLSVLIHDKNSPYFSQTINNLNKETANVDEYQSSQSDSDINSNINNNNNDNSGIQTDNINLDKGAT